MELDVNVDVAHLGSYLISTIRPCHFNDLISWFVENHEIVASPFYGFIHFIHLYNFHTFTTWPVDSPRSSCVTGILQI